MPLGLGMHPIRVVLVPVHNNYVHAGFISGGEGVLSPPLGIDLPPPLAIGFPYI